MLATIHFTVLLSTFCFLSYHMNVFCFCLLSMFSVRFHFPLCFRAKTRENLNKYINVDIKLEVIDRLK